MVRSYWRHLYGYAITCEYANTVLAHLPRRIGRDFVLVFELNAKHSIRQHLVYDAFQFHSFFFSHLCSKQKKPGTPASL